MSSVCVFLFFFLQIQRERKKRQLSRSTETETSNDNINTDQSNDAAPTQASPSKKRKTSAKTAEATVRTQESQENSVKRGMEGETASGDADIDALVGGLGTEGEDQPKRRKKKKKKVVLARVNFHQLFVFDIYFGRFTPYDNSYDAIIFLCARGRRRVEIFVSTAIVLQILKFP